MVVAELVPAVVAWNRGPLGEQAGHPLRDPRVTVRAGDVARVLMAGQPAYDAILLDVDNGPEGLTRKENDWLYGMDGLNAAYASLRLAVCWRYGRPVRIGTFCNGCERWGSRWMRCVSVRVDRRGRGTSSGLPGADKRGQSPFSCSGRDNLTRQEEKKGDCPLLLNSGM